MLKPVKNFIKAIPGVKPLLKIRNNIRAEYNYNRHQKMTYDEIEKEISRSFFKSFRRKLNWDNPQTFNEKIKVSMLYNPTELKTRLADKVLARDYISEKLGDKYLTKIYGVYNSFDEINFENLPESFVIKCNHDSGGYYLVPDKRKFDIKAARKKITKCINKNYAWYANEMHYKNIPPKIFIEEYINGAMNDYRFFCFDGVPYYCAIDFHDEKNKIISRNFYNMQWNLQEFSLGYPQHLGSDVPCPENYSEMQEIAKKLSSGIDQVRIDLYQVKGKIYTGELTFTHAGGTQHFLPDEWDFKMGALWKFDNTIRQKVREKNLKP